MGLESGQVNDLALAGENLWVATQAGVAAYDGQTWTAFTPENSGLSDPAVFALAVQPLTQGELVWFGSSSAVVSYNTHTGAWQAASGAQVGLGWGGVSDLLVDSSGRLWVSTLGGGISRWDGLGWTTLRTSNSDLPYNTVTDVEELQPGVFWIATSIPNNTGGVVSRLEGEEWQTFKPIFSGYTGAETLAISRDARGRLWFATRTRGIYIYEERK
jgi:ligand-binding sensor domain-containing protein